MPHYNADKIKESLRILGFAPNEHLNPNKLKRNYLKTIQRVHPDQGGNDYLCQQVNEAKDILEWWISIGQPSQNWEFENSQESREKPKEEEQKSTPEKNFFTWIEHPLIHKNYNRFKLLSIKGKLFVIVLSILGLSCLHDLIFPTTVHNNPKLVQTENTSPPPPISEQVRASMPAAENKYKETDTQRIARETGLLITQISDKGEQLPANGYVSDASYRIKFKGKEIDRDSLNSYLRFDSLYTVNNRQVVLVAYITGGNACPATYKLITIFENDAKISKEFGNCGAPTVNTLPDELQFEFYDGYGKRILNTYKDGNLKEIKLTHTRIKDPDDKTNDYQYLLKHVSSSNLENILEDKKLADTLTTLLGSKNFEGLKKRLDLAYVTRTGDFIEISGQQAHAGGSEEAYLMIELNGEHLYAGILSTDFNATPLKSSIKLFSDKPAMFTSIPNNMQEWIDKYPDAKKEWVFKE